MTGPPRVAGRVPAPVDARLVPAVVATLAVCLTVPALPTEVVWSVPWAIALAATAVTLTLVLVLRRRDRPWGLTSILAAVCIAVWFAALAATQAVSERVPAVVTGWEQAVAQQEPVRISATATNTPTRSAGTFGARWHLPVTVTAFGHPVRTLDPGTEVMVSAGSEWSAVGEGHRLCFIGVPERSGETTFVRARTAPTAGGCTAGTSAEVPPTESEQTDEAHAGNTGRDQIRNAVRHAARGSISTAPQLLPGLVLGDRSEQGPALDEAMKTSGLSHLSAVSGANCTLVAGAVTMLLRTLRVHRAVVLTAVLAVLGVFVLVVGFEPSVIRAAVMGGLGAWAVFCGRGRQALPVLCLAVCLLLLWQPSLAGEAAFQLSVAATAGIVLGARPLEQWLTTTLSRWLPGPVAGTVGAALAVTVCAQIACQPLLIDLSGTMSVYAVPANLLAAPLVPLITVPGTLAAALAVPLPAVAAAIFWVIGWPAAGIGWIASTVAAWPGALHPWPTGALGVAMTVLHVSAALTLGWLLLRWERARAPRVRRLGTAARAREPTRQQRRAGWVLLGSGAVICSAAGSQLALVTPPPTGPLPADWAVAACDVGQGDMTVLRTGAHSAVVVDTGPEPGLAADCLDRLEVRNVDLLVLSHLHRDHAGAVMDVADCCAPAAILYSTIEAAGTGSVPSTARPGEALEAAGSDAAAEAGAPGAPVRLPPGAVQARAGQHGQFGTVTAGEVEGGGGDRGEVEDGDTRRDGTAGEWGVEWTVLAAENQATNENDASMQLWVRQLTPQGSFTVLLTGDMEEEMTARLLRQGIFPGQVDVVKVAHHGARNGGLELARALEPSLAMIQVGAENTYGHPHPAIVAEWSRHGPVVRTDVHGTAVLSLRDGRLVPSPSGPRVATTAAPVG